MQNNSYMNLFRKPAILFFVLLAFCFIIVSVAAKEDSVNVTQKSLTTKSQQESSAQPKTLPAIQSKQPSQSTQPGKSRSWFIVPPPQDSYLPMMVRPGYWGGRKRNIGFGDFFIPVLGKDETFLFFNPKLSWDDHHNHEYNLGLGIRSLRFDQKVILGINSYFDNKDVNGAGYFKQAGLGLEALSDFMDFRLNYYWALSSKKEVESSSTYSFASYSLLEYTTPGYIEPMSGLDYEAGILVPGISKIMETRFYVGGYNYFAKLGKDINGFSTRLDIMPSPLMNIDLQLKNDNVNGTEVYGGFYVSLPFEIGNIAQGKNPFDGWKDLFAFGKGTRPLKDRMTDMVIRDIDVITEETTGPTTESTEVSGMIYVDNSNTGTEDGSYENPYNTIQEGIDNAFGDKWVYVREGSGSYIEGVDLTSGITLWGSGYNGGFNGITAPGYPVVDGSVSGRAIHIQDVDNCKIMGVHAQSGIGVIYIQNSTNITINNSIITDNEKDFAGIYLITAPLITDITITDNTFSNNEQNSIYIRTPIMSPEDQYCRDVTISGNTFSNDQHAIHIENADSGIFSNINITGNTITDSNHMSIYYYSWPQAISNDGITITNNTITDGLNKAIWFSIDGSEFTNLTISNNTISDCQMGIGVVVDEGGSLTGGVLSGNTITDNSAGGLVLNSQGSDSDPSSLSCKVSRNIIANNVGYGIEMDSASLQNTLIADLGGGILGSEGYNSIYGNTIDAYAGGAGDPSIKAENNWWGQADDPASLIDGDVDYTPWLTSDPN